MQKLPAGLHRVEMLQIIFIVVTSLNVARIA